MRDHPYVLLKGRELGLGYDEAEAVARGSRDPAAKAAVAQIDAARKKDREAASRLNAGMAEKLGLGLDAVRGLLVRLAADPALETWFVRRLNLTRAAGAPPDDDEHPVNA